MISNRHGRPFHGLNMGVASAIATAAAAVIAACSAAAARAEQPPLTCDAEVAQINQALLLTHQPVLCDRCSERLARTLESLYRSGVLPNFYTSADAANWDDPQRRPAMMSGQSLARMADGADLLADIDSGYGPRGIFRLRYTQANQPVALTTVDRSISLPVSLCTPAAAR